MGLFSKKNTITEISKDNGIVDYSTGKLNAETFDILFPENMDSDNAILGMKESPTEDFRQNSHISKEMEKEIGERTSNAVLETKMLPVTLMTDGNTATQVLMLLEMIRYGLEESAKDGKEYAISLSVRNRGKSKLLISVGDESMPPIPHSEKYFIGS